MDAQSLFYMALLFIGLFAAGRHFRDATVGIIGGFGLFLLGFNLIVNPVVTFSELINTAIGSIFVGLGAYIWIVGGLELLKEKGWL